MTITKKWRFVLGVGALILIAAYLGYYFGPNAPCTSGREITADEAIEIAKKHAIGDVYFWRDAAGLDSSAQLVSRISETPNCCSAGKRSEWGSYYWVASVGALTDRGRLDYTARISPCGRFFDAAW